MLAGRRQLHPSIGTVMRTPAPGISCRKALGKWGSGSTLLRGAVSTDWARRSGACLESAPTASEKIGGCSTLLADGFAAFDVGGKSPTRIAAQFLPVRHVARSDTRRAHGGSRGPGGWAARPIRRGAAVVGGCWGGASTVGTRVFRGTDVEGWQRRRRLIVHLVPRWCRTVGGEPLGPNAAAALPARPSSVAPCGREDSQGTSVREPE